MLCYTRSTTKECQGKFKNRNCTKRTSRQRCCFLLQIIFSVAVASPRLRRRPLPLRSAPHTQSPSMQIHDSSCKDNVLSSSLLSTTYRVRQTTSPTSHG